MPTGKMAFATIGALCATLATSTQADDRTALEAAPLPVARPADLNDGQRQNEDSPEKSAGPAAEKPSAFDDPSSPRSQFRALLRREAGLTGLPFDIADTVAAIESGYDPTVIGAVGEVGLMQVRPETAAMLGFHGDLAELAKPEINIHYGVTYLAEAWRLANGDICRALMKYRAGHNEEQMSALSAAYCGRARTHLAAIGSPLAAGVSVPAVADLLPIKLHNVRRGLPPVRTEAVSRAFWAAQEARVAALTRRVQAKWRKMASR